MTELLRIQSLRKEYRKNRWARAPSFVLQADLAFERPAIVGVLGVVANRFFFRPLAREHEFTILLSSLGLAILLTNGSELLFGADPKYIASSFADETVDIGPVTVTEQLLLLTQPVVRSVTTSE